MQIRSKLTLQFILIVATIMLIAFYYIRYQFNGYLQDEFFKSLKSKAYLTGEMLVGKLNDQNLEIGNTNHEDNSLQYYNENISIYNASNKLIYSFNPISKFISTDKLHEIRSKQENRFARDRYSAIGVLYRNNFGIEYVIVAESIFNSQQLQSLTQILIWVYIIFILLVAISGYIFSGQALAPVNLVINEVESILPSDMSHRLKDTNQKDEISRLVFTFNKLLERIQKVFVNQKMFLSNLSHEIKNPLNVILTQIEVVRQKDRDISEYKKTLDSVFEDILELNDVSTKLMELSKINYEGSSVVFSPFRLDETLWQVRSTLIKSKPGYKVEMQFNDLPDDENLLYFLGNEQLIKAALLNIMDNGCKYSKDKEVKVNFYFNESGNPFIEVVDSGIGINEEEKEMLFEPFYRGKNATVVKGSGIGLSLVKSIFEMHKITFSLNSQLGKGSVFKIVFPFRHETSDISFDYKLDSSYQL